jgi:hypothetical protein
VVRAATSVARDAVLFFRKARKRPLDALGIVLRRPVANIPDNQTLSR